MPDTPHLLAFMAAGLLLNLTPGPDVFFILTNAVRRGARAGLVAALGIAAGCCVHIVAAAAGVSALVAASATAFAVLKWVGAAYLVYVGVAMLFARAKADAPDAVCRIAARCSSRTYGWGRMPAGSLSTSVAGPPGSPSEETTSAAPAKSSSTV